MALRQVLIPAVGVWFFTFVGVEATARGGWPMLATAAAVWLLFVNSASHGGMILWREQDLLRGGLVRPGALVVAGAVMPLALFVVHLSLIALTAPSRTGGGLRSWTAMLLPAWIAAVSGLGVGILASLWRERWPPSWVSLGVPLGSLFFTPIFYTRFVFGKANAVWCAVNPLCVAVDLARGAIGETRGLPPFAVSLGVGMSFAVLLLAFFQLRLRPIFARA
jgi:ABC-type polysaccharide/polyol phosphate export permease